MLHVLWSILIGFFVGLIARALLPGSDQLGFLGTVAVGILGSILGGFLGRMMRRPAPGEPVHPAGLLMSLLGAVVLLVLLRFVR